VKLFFTILTLILFPTGWLILGTDLLLGFKTGLSEGDTAKVMIWLPYCIGVSSFISGLIASIRYQYELVKIKTPKIEMEYYGTDFKVENNNVIGVAAYIELTGVSTGETHFYIYCSDVKATRKGSQNLRLNRGSGMHRFLPRGEKTRIQVLLLEWNGVPAPYIKCCVPWQGHEDEIARGGEFLVNLSAFGDMEPVHIQLRCGADLKNHSKFLVEQVIPMEKF